MKQNSQQIDPTIPHIEFLGINPSLDGDRSNTIYRYKVTLPGIEPCLIEERRGDVVRQFKSWLQLAKEQHPECFQKSDANGYIHIDDAYLQEWIERVEEIRQMALSGSLFD